MKKFSIYITVFLILTAFGFGCRKEMPYENTGQADTIFPKPYLPIYPNSFWQYRNTFDSTLFTDYAGAYQLTSGNEGNSHSKEYYGPTWHGHTYLGYNYTTGSTYNNSQHFIAELKEDVSDEWMTIYGSTDRYDHIGTTWEKRMTDSTGLTKTVGDSTYTNVIKVVERQYSSLYMHSFGAWYYYYAKDVGLIEKGTIDRVTLQNTGVIYYLEHYHIYR